MVLSPSQNLLRDNPILDPDRTTSDQILITADPRNLRNPKHPSVSRLSTGNANSEEEDDEEEDNRINLYVNRAAELSSGQSSHRESGPVRGHLKDNPAAEEIEDPQVEPDQYESNTERVCFIPEGGRQTGVQEPNTGQEKPNTSQEEEIQDICGDVNLFSVTLASLAPCYEEEDTNSFTDLLKEHRLNSRNEGDSETVQNYQTFGKDLSEFSRRPADPCIQPEEEEEEEFSAYLTHR